jgi:MinD-like ATPase involved in chromosome partitioning or flagellar assembly
MNNISTGEIITFYSYKGGTGRSMALANVACLLSFRQKNNKVLMIDWDLEAPGLHHFFRGKFDDVEGATIHLPTGQAGLIDLFYDLKNLLLSHQTDDGVLDDVFDQINIENYIVKINTEYSSLSLMPAGRSDDGLYSKRVNEFNWSAFYSRYPSIITQFANYLINQYDYALIDSRTGHTDISGICTSIMPEKLVVVFTPNRQNISGVSETIHVATGYRVRSNDTRPLLVFPLQSRIENAESKLKEEWRFDSKQGYQIKFESVLRQVYDLEECSLQKYFNTYKLPYVPKYSYGENLAVLEDDSDDTSSLAYEFKKFTAKLISDENPWEESEDTIGEISLNLQKIQRISNSTRQVFFQTGALFVIAVLASFFYFFGNSLGFFQILYEFVNWQYFYVIITIWLIVDFSWMSRWKSFVNRAAKILNKPWVFTEDNTPQNVSGYPRMLLENFAIFSTQSFNFKFGKRITPSGQLRSQFFNSLSNVVFNPEHPSSTLGNVLLLFLFASFTLASSIVISNTLSEIGLVSSALPSIFQRLDFPLLAGTILSLIAGMWMFLEIAGISRIIDIYKSDIRKKYLLGGVAVVVSMLSFFTIIGLSLKQIDLFGNLFGLSNVIFIETIALGLPAITTSLGAVLVFDSAVRGFITVLYFLLIVFFGLLPVLAFLADLFWRTLYIVIDFLQWLVLTPIIAIPHFLSEILVVLGIFPEEERDKHET